MKKLIFIGIVLLLAGAAVFVGFLGSNDWKISSLGFEDDSVEKSFSSAEADSAIDRIEIDFYSAELEVRRGGENISLTYYEKSYLKYETQANDGVFRVKESGKRKFSKDSLLYLKNIGRPQRKSKLSIPESYSGALKIETLNGNIDITGDFVNIRIDSVNGDIGLKNVRADSISIKNVNGNFSLENVESPNITLATTNGRLSASGVRAESFSADTTNGALRLSDLVCKSAELETTNGEILVDSSTLDTLRAETTNGRISVELIGIGTEYDIIAKKGSKTVIDQRGTDANKAVFLSTTNGGINVVFVPPAV